MLAITSIDLWWATSNANGIKPWAKKLTLNGVLNTVSEAKKNSGNDEQEIKAALSKHPEVIVEIEQGTLVSRVQPTEFDDPIFYNPNSDTRYGDQKKEIGVCYVAGSSEVAIAETFQHGPDGPGTPVLIKDIEERSLHQLITARPLKVVDVGRLAARAGKKLRHIVEAKGQGSEGYALTQLVSAVSMRHSDEIDGLIYTSTVFPAAVSLVGCNLVLFGGRETQLVAESAAPLAEVLLVSGETAVEFLVSLSLSVE